MDVGYAGDFGYTVDVEDVGYTVGVENVGCFFNKYFNYMRGSEDQIC